MHARRLWALVCVACWPVAAPAAFDPTDVIQIQATVGMRKDNNLFRLPDLDPRLFGIDPANKSDRATIKGIGLRLDKLVSRQRLIGELDLNETTYDKNTVLDYTGGTTRLAWLWQVGNHWSGEASFRKERILGGFDDFRQRARNLVDTETYSLSGGYRFHPRWRAHAELIERERTHSAPARQTLDHTAKIAGVGLTYRTPADNTVGLRARRTDRSYPNRIAVGPITIDNGHQESRLNALLGWRLSSALRADAELGYVDLTHDRLSQRDFSGITWKAEATWDPTAKLRFALSSSKDVRPYEDLVTSYVVVNAVRLTPLYAITPKILLQGDFSYEKRDHRGDPGFVAGVTGREDNVRLARMGVTYTPIRNVDLSLSYENGERRSNIPLNSFDYQAWFGSLRLSF